MSCRPTTTKMKQMINEILQEKLDKATYQSDRASVLTKEIADAIKAKLKGAHAYMLRSLPWEPRLKFVAWALLARLQLRALQVRGPSRHWRTTWRRSTVRYNVFQSSSSPKSTASTHAKVGVFLRGNERRMGCRCFWDAETDCYASETFSNVRHIVFSVSDIMCPSAVSSPCASGVLLICRVYRIACFASRQRIASTCTKAAC
jgi:hypothetical protein